MSATNNERDEFWDIDKLIPKKKTAISKFASNQRTFEHNISGLTAEDTSERRLTFPRLSEEKKADDVTYIPEGDGLIRRVTIKRNADRYDFYGSFRKAALIYHDYKTDRCDFAPFYSYMPQYSQLTAAQKNYYFYWRGEVRKGKYIKSDYSYIYLFVYEILNLPDKIPPEEGIMLLCALWREYRGALPRIDAYFSVWLQDYCLVYNIPCPMARIRDFIFDIIGASDFKEFYLSDMESAGEDGTDAMIAYLSDYDWKRGKYAATENAELYKEHMQKAMRILLRYLGFGQKRSSLTPTVVKRDAFPHSLCTHAVKCKLEIEYLPLARDERLRAAVTAGVRYTENKLRALFGIKSRLAVKDFPDEYKLLIDKYFSTIFEEEHLKRRKDNIPEYEKLYDAPREALSFAGADEIERSSWTTTLRLVDEETEAEEQVMEKAAPDEKSAGAAADSYGLIKADIELIRAAYNGNSEGIDDEAMERINEAFADGYGDVILEFDGERYIIIEDYKEEIGEWLLKLTK